MAEIQQVQQLPAPFIEAAGKTYLEDLAGAIGGIKTLDVSKTLWTTICCRTKCINTTSRIFSRWIRCVINLIYKQQQAATGPTAYQAYMSPYQQDVISTTLQEFDVQAQKGIPQLQAQAVAQGAFGGGREGVALAEYQAASDRNRAALQAQLLQQGFGQAQQLAGQQFPTTNLI